MRVLSIYSIADLHLSGAVEKPMDVFGSRWRDHTAKIERHWRDLVRAEDSVIVPGDISWALTLDEALPDLRFIDSLPGVKYLGKGNHDFWWSTMAKMTAALDDAGITSIRFLYNNAYEIEDYIVCGSRGWYVEEKYQNTKDEVDYQKIVDREAARLELSFKAGEALRGERTLTMLCYLHFPPVFGDFVCREIVDVIKAHGVTHVYYGHIHGNYSAPRYFEFEGIGLSMISADFLNFVPMITMPIDY